MATQTWPFSPGDVPPEIWSKIFDFACLDEGFTARSLSLVSRHVRDVSEDHRHHTIHISSTSQMIAFERQLCQSGVIAAGGTLKARFIYIAFPINAVEDAYPMDAPGVWAPSSEAGDSDYQDSGPEWATIYPSSDDDTSDSDGEDEVCGLRSIDEEDLVAESVDLRNDEQNNIWTPQVAKSIDDLKHCSPAVGMLQYQVYGAGRRVLEAASKTLQVLSFYHYPLRLFQLEAVIPPLPRLLRLSIGLPPTGGFRYMGDPHPMHYPSLQVLRLLGWSRPTADWWRRIIESVPDSSQVTIVSVLRIYRMLGYCKRQGGSHVWKFVKNDFDQGALPISMKRWWLDDVNGGSGIPSEEELDEKHGNGYRYETDDDL